MAAKDCAPASGGRQAILTERLLLRRFGGADSGGFRALIRDKMSGPYHDFDEPFPVDDEGLDAVLRYFTASDEFFAVVLRPEGRVIGFASLNRAEAGARNLGFCIHSAYQGQGYATEAAAALKQYAKEALGVQKLVSGTAEVNLPAMRLLRSAGFRVMRREQASFTKDGAGQPILFTACTMECAL